MKPDHYSFPSVLKACAGIGDVSLGLVSHCMLVKLGFENYIVVGSSVLDFYTKSGNLNDARMVFDGLSFKDSAAWNSMISRFSKTGFFMESLDCFRNMLGNKGKMDSMTIPTLLNVCGKLGDITKGKEIHGQVLKNAVLYKDIAIRNSLSDLYSKCGSLFDAEKIFSSTKNLNLVTWTTMISCYGVHVKQRNVGDINERSIEFGSPDYTIIFYISEKIGNSLIDKMHELACFAPGMIALGSSGYGPDESQKFLNLAEELDWTCYNFYQSTPTKLAGENYFFHSGQVYMEIECPDGGNGERLSGFPATHEEIHPTGILSVVGNLTPWSDHNQSPRNMYQCRADQNLYHLQTPQTPIVRTATYEKYRIDDSPLGTNAIVAVLAYSGYHMEDAMVLNKSSVDRGFAHGHIYQSESIDLADKKSKYDRANICPCQPGVTECGYYVLKFMKEIVDEGLDLLVKNNVGGRKNEYTDADLDEIREEWSRYVLNFIYV